MSSFQKGFFQPYVKFFNGGAFLSAVNIPQAECYTKQTEVKWWRIIMLYL